MITREQWKELVDKYEKYCPYEEVHDASSYEVAEKYIKNMPVLGALYEKG